MPRKPSPSSIVKGDRVRVIRGNFRDMEGPVLRVIRAKDRVVVEGVNMRKRHERPSEANPLPLASQAARMIPAAIHSNARI